MAVLSARHGAPGGRGSRRRQRPPADRRGRPGGHYFVGPDNGLLGSLLRPAGRARRRPDRPRATIGRRCSRTFHGRTMLRAGGGRTARAACGCSALGPPLASPVRLARSRRATAARRVGRRGAPGRPLREPPRRVSEGRICRGRPIGASCGSAARASAGWLGPTPSGPDGRLGAVIDSSGRVEVSVREGSARRRLVCRARGRPRQLEGVGGFAPRRRLFDEAAFEASASRTPRSSRASRSSRTSDRSTDVGAPSTRPSPVVVGARRRSRRSTSSRPPSPSSGPRRDSRSRTSRRLSRMNGAGDRSRRIGPPQRSQAVSGASEIRCRTS